LPNVHTEFLANLGTTTAANTGSHHFGTDADNVSATVSCGTVTGTNPTLTPILQKLGEDGVWVDVHSFAPLTASNQSRSVELRVRSLLTSDRHSVLRFRWTVTGTTPSFQNLTFTVVGTA
jgi:hypothetical protein